MQPYDDSRTAEILGEYDAAPLDDGDAVLVLDDRVCFEVKALADHWDRTLRTRTAALLRRTPATRVAVAIARSTELRPGDYQVWRDLHADLQGSDVELLPLRVLKAA